VGTASELPLARRAQLAVVAHIRHLYTDYDRLLKSGSFHEARSTVEQPTLAKLVAWRGDDENGQKVLEDVFREVIVISDDDDDSEVEEDALTSTDNRDHSVEILSSHARAHDIQTRPVSLLNTATLDPLREMSEEAPPGFRIIPSVPKKAVDRRGFSRYQAWNRALTKYGTNAAAQSTEPVRSNGASTEQPSPRHGKRPIPPVHEAADPPRRRDIAPNPHSQPPESGHTRVVSGPSRFENTAHRKVNAPERISGSGHLGPQDRRGLLEVQRTVSHQYGSSGLPVLTTQKSSEFHRLDQSPRSSGIAPYPPGKPHLNSNPRTEWIPTTNPSANAPVFVNGHKEIRPINQGQSQSQFMARTEAPISHAPRPGAVSQDYVLPSIEAPWPQDRRKMDGRLESMTKRMSLRSVTPKQPGESSQPGSPDDPLSKRRRLAYHVPPLQESRPDPWNPRPIAAPVSEALAPRGSYRREELVPEYRVQDGTSARREYLAPADTYQRDRQVPQDARPLASLDRARLVDPHNHIHMHPQSGPPITSGMVPDERALRVAPGIPPRPAYYDDRSPHARPAVIDSPRDRHVPGVSSNGKLYADGFVRHVDFREVRPVEYFVQRRTQLQTQPQPQPQPRGRERDRESSGQPRTRMPEHYMSKDRSQTQPPEQHPSPVPRVTHTHDQTPHYPAALPGTRQPRGPAPNTRDRRLGSGPGPKRRGDPRSFQMAEQSRPIYVQRVEPQPPQYNMSEGRHVVIVD
jgi:hypothetical protein